MFTQRRGGEAVIFEIPRRVPPRGNEGSSMAKSIELQMRVWFDPTSRHIKLAGPNLTASTVSNDPGSKRYHPNLYMKLSRALRAVGAPAPEE